LRTICIRDNGRVRLRGRRAVIRLRDVADKRTGQDRRTRVQVTVLARLVAVQDLNEIGAVADRIGDDTI